MGNREGKRAKTASVIVPVYNTKPFLRRCLASLAAQEYEDLEIVLVDDGSTDGSSEICDEFAENDPRVRVIHQGNRGVSAARNAGMTSSTGKYVLFVDADDYVLPGHVGHLVGVLEQFDAQVSTGMGRMSDYGDGTKGKGNPRAVGAERAIEMLLCYRCPVQVWGKAYVRSFLMDSGISFPEDISVGEDFVFNCRAFQEAERVAVTPRNTYFHCKENPDSVTTRFDPQKWESGLRAMVAIRDSLRFQTPRVIAAWEYANWRTHSDAYDLIVLSRSEKANWEMYERCLAVTRGQALKALRVPVSVRDKLRAVTMSICPKAIPWAMVRRRKRSGTEVSSQAWR